MKNNSLTYLLALFAFFSCSAVLGMEQDDQIKDYRDKQRKQYENKRSQQEKDQNEHYSYAHSEKKEKRTHYCGVPSLYHLAAKELANASNGTKNLPENLEGYVNVLKQYKKDKEDFAKLRLSHSDDRFIQGLREKMIKSSISSDDLVGCPEEMKFNVGDVLDKYELMQADFLKKACKEAPHDKKHLEALLLEIDFLKMSDRHKYSLLTSVYQEFKSSELAVHMFKLLLDDFKKTDPNKKLSEYKLVVGIESLSALEIAGAIRSEKYISDFKDSIVLCDDNAQYRIFELLAQAGLLEQIKYLIGLIEKQKKGGSIAVLKKLLFHHALPIILRVPNKKQYLQTAWNESNRDVAEYIFELLLDDFVENNPGKQRYEFVIETQYTYAERVFPCRDYNFAMRLPQKTLIFNALMVSAHIGSLKYVNEFIQYFDVSGKVEYYDPMRISEAQCGITALFEAIRSNNKDVSNFLVDAGADASLYIAYFNNIGEKEVVRALYNGMVKSCKTDNELIHKQFNNGVPIVNYVTSFGLHTKIYNLLECVDMVGHFDLYKNKPIDDAYKQFVTTRFDNGLTLLEYAAFFGFVDEVDRLIKKGADVGHKDVYGNTPLFYAVKAGRWDVVNLLLKKGADINATNNYGQTALFWCSDRELFKVLLENGATIPAYKKDNRHPLEGFISGFEAECYIAERDKDKGYKPDDQCVKMILLCIDKMKKNDLEPFQPLLSLRGSHDFLIKNRRAIFKAIFDKGLKPSCEIMFKDGKAIFVASDLLDFFIENGLDVNAHNTDGHTLLAVLENRLNELLGMKQKTYEKKLEKELLLTFIELIKTKGGKLSTKKSRAFFVWHNKYLILGSCAVALMGWFGKKRFPGLACVGLIFPFIQAYRVYTKGLYNFRFEK